MQILYIANEQSDKQAVVNALRGIGPDVAIACTSRLDVAPRWIDDNPDVAALVVDTPAETQLTVQFLKHVRRSGLNAPVIVLTHDQAGRPIDALKAGADDYIVKDQALFDELPRVVGNLIARVHKQVGTGATKRLRILYAGDAALARTCVERTPYSIQVTEAVADPNDTPQPLPSELRAAAVPLPFDMILVEHGYRGLDIFAILKELASRELPIPVILVVEWDDDLALPAIKMGAADFVVRAHEPLGALFFRLGRDHFEEARTRRGELRVSDETSERSGEDEADDRSEQERARIREFEQRLEASETALKDAEQWRASDIAKCTARFGDERAQLESKLVELAAERNELAEKLNLAETVAERAERLRSWEALNSAELSERTAELRTQLAHAVRGRDAVKQQLCHAEDVAEAARRAHAAAAEAVEQLTRRETDLQAVLATAKEDRDAFDRRLTNAEAALMEAGERATGDRIAATKRQAELETRLDSEVQRRDALERQLAETEAAYNSAEQLHASALATANAQRAEREAKYEISLARAAAAWEMVNEQLSEAGLAVDRARKSQATTAAALERVTCREAELSARLAEANASHDELTVRLAEMETERRAADERASHEQAAATERQTALRSELHQETQTRQRLEEELADVERTRLSADDRHRSAMEAAAGQFARRDAELETQLKQAEETRRRLERQLNDAGLAIKSAQQDRASAIATVGQLSRREAELAGLLTEAIAGRDVLTARVTETEAARKDAEEQARREKTTATERQVEFEARLETEVATRQRLETRLAAEETERKAAEDRHETSMKAAAAGFADRCAELEAKLKLGDDARQTLRQQLSVADVALEQSRQQQLTATATLEQLTRRDAELTSQLAKAMSMFDALSVRLADAEAARRDAVESARQGEGAATERQSRLQARLDEETETRQRLEGRLADEEAARKIADEVRETLSQQLCVVQAVADEGRQREQVTTAALERMTRREAELTFEVFEAAAAHQELTVRLAKAEAARQDADARARHEQASATERYAALEARLEQATVTHRHLESKLADEESARMSAAASLEEMTNREADLTARLIEATAACDCVTVRLADEESARQAAEEQHATAMKTAAAQLAEQSTQFESALSQAAEAQDALSQRLKAAEAAVEEARRQQLAASAALEHMTRREAERSAQLAEVTAAREGLTARLADMEAARRDADERTRTEQAAATERQGQLEVRLKQAAEAQERLDQQLSVATSTCDVLTVRLSAAEAAGKEAHDEIVKVRSVAEGAQRGLELERDSLQKALDVIEEQLQREKSKRADVQDRVDQLQNVSEIQLGDSAKRFDQVPLAVVRCTRDGVLTQANRAFAVLTGYQADDLIAESAPRAFEMSDELSGLIQRCLQTGAVETIETRWKRKDGGHLHVRVSAFATTQGVDIAAEDISSLRSLQARLDRAQRMEAVGRLASEVAVTCGNLLSDVSEDGQRWLATLGSDAAVRQRGTALLRDVTRAASFLRQLTADGDEQADRREPVDVTRLLRDMEPVLKRVAGEHIKLVMPKTTSRGSSPIHVDLMADRVERLLVNVASYGRERMPFGGRLIFDLTTVDVDQQFVARYPNVRRGPHALITVTEVADPSRTGGTLAFRDARAEARAGTSVLEKPGLDLGTLQALVRGCGGHLWMEVQPPGQMVAKIHLPLRVGDEPVHSIAATKQTRLGRSLGRLFHH